MNLLTPPDIRRLAKTAGVRPTKQLGQNFVHDAGVVRRIVREAHVEAGDLVLEVGPGLGSLTLGLLEAGANVIAVEIDDIMAPLLPRTIASFAPEASDHLAVLHADALTITGPEDLPVPAAAPKADGDSAPMPTKLVANLPYNVATPVLLTLLEALPSIEEVLVMVQAEVADRIAEPPGTRTYGIPSAKAAWYASAARAGTISRAVFWPAPNVDSALVRLIRREPPATSASRAEVFAVIDGAFAQRRKTLRAALAGWAGNAPAAERILRAAGIDPQRRGETLAIEEFAKIAEARELSTREVRVSAPGKVNLYLAVGPVDESGYHPLATVFQALDIADDVVVSHAEELSLVMHDSDIPVDESNLAMRAARALAAHARIEARAAIEITKRIPVAGGMAGGSADAAGTLVALDALWGLQTPREELLEIAATLGADVPFILVGGTALGTRRGDLIAPLDAMGEYSWVLITQEEGHSTPRAFAVFDAAAPADLPQPEVDQSFLQSIAVGDVGAVVRGARNDLAEICLANHAGARAAADACEELGVPWIVSGSGPTIAALAEGDPEELRAALAVRLDGARCLIARGPHAGARIMS